ncbi:MAG: aminomethyltransferase [archaeon GW2011_AR10]|uniref:Probable aminomethyltransferase n=1 Tax=Candidatus Iainarchaeum sp. TaxID=3101447 RepID=A0A7J4IQT4_9ARCH|nr:MAG: aminomethyltransferase [archaeon GW2011_AR10]HIH07792.1 glycine cleavage system aminomethyltransferase GcvT [Candidatus Diapherotrites archaeon]
MGSKTPLFEEHKKLGAKIIDFLGWDMPVYYSSVIDEHNATRSKVTVFDTCHMGEFRVEGKHAFDLVQKAVTRDISKLKSGQMALGCLCNERGGVLDDLTVYRFSDEKYMVVVNASTIEKDFLQFRKVKEQFGFHCKLTNESSTTAKIDVQGPIAEKILQKISNAKLDGIKFYNFVEGKILGFNVVISRSGYTGEDGFELYFSSSKAAVVWNALLEKGKEAGIKPAGLGARDTLRLESAFNLYGSEMDESRTPIECRYAWVTDLGKDFIGRDALLKQKNVGLKEKLVGFEMTDKAIARHGYKIFVEGREAGVVTSGSFSPTLKKNIGLGYIKAEFSDIGTNIEVEVREKKFNARIVRLPFYSREKK